MTRLWSFRLLYEVKRASIWSHVADEAPLAGNGEEEEEEEREKTNRQTAREEKKQPQTAKEREGRKERKKERLFERVNLAHWSE